MPDSSENICINKTTLPSGEQHILRLLRAKSKLYRAGVSIDKYQPVEALILNRFPEMNTAKNALLLRRVWYRLSTEESVIRMIETLAEEVNND